VSVRLLRWIVLGITDERLHVRLVRTAVSFLLVYYVAMLGSYLLLPEGILRGRHPIISSLQFSTDPWVMGLQVFAYNIIPACLIAASNLLAERSRIARGVYVPIGYSAFWVLVGLFGAVTGTWSFDVVTTAPPIASRAWHLFDVAHHAGLLEFVGYLLIAVTSSRLVLWYSDGRRIVRSRAWKDIVTPPIEKVLLAGGFAMLLVAAGVEAAAIARLAGL